MDRTRRTFLRVAGSMAAAGSTALAGCSGVLDSDESDSDDRADGSTKQTEPQLVGDDFEDGTFAYSAYTNDSTDYDWGTRSVENAPSGEDRVGYLREHSLGSGHTIRLFSDETYDFSGARGLDLLCRSPAYSPDERWNNGRFHVWSAEAESRDLSISLFNTDSDGEERPFNISGQLVEDRLESHDVAWTQNRWYRVSIDFEETDGVTVARGKIWDPVNEDEPDSFQAESVLSEPLGDAHRVGFTASGRSEPLEVEYDYWQVRR